MGDLDAFIAKPPELKTIPRAFHTPRRPSVFLPTSPFPVTRSAERPRVNDRAQVEQTNKGPYFDPGACRWLDRSPGWRVGEPEPLAPVAGLPVPPAACVGVAEPEAAAGTVAGVGSAADGLAWPNPDSGRTPESDAKFETSSHPATLMAITEPPIMPTCLTFRDLPPAATSALRDSGSAERSSLATSRVPAYEKGTKPTIGKRFY